MNLAINNEKILYLYNTFYTYINMRSLILISLVILGTMGIAQENTANYWYFGYQCGISFATGVPKGVTGGQITGLEGCATVGDMQGNLLFYTDGQVVYDRNHNIMQNGTGLMGHYSSTQSSIIVKCPGTENYYYLFTTDGAENHLEGGWRYSIVDMSLNGGLGAVTGVKNILLEGPVAEKQTAIMHSNNVSVWVISHRWNSNEFVAYEITQEGISPVPVVSAIGAVHEGGPSGDPNLNGWTNATGLLRANKEGDKIALAIQITGIFEVFDFDKSTGVVSNCKTSSAYNPVYGVEFSPDGTKLYATVNVYQNSRLYQFNLNQVDPFSNSVLIASESDNPIKSLQMGPNGKIYITRYNYGYVSAINNPNATGTACGYISNAVYLMGKTGRNGLPNIFYYKGFRFFTGSEQTISICEGDSIYLEGAYQHEAGTFTDTLQTALDWDSIVTTYLELLPAPEIPVITEFNGVLYCTPADNYQWYRNGTPIAGADNQLYQPFVSGYYTVEVVWGNGCHSVSEGFNFIVQSIVSASDEKRMIYPNPCGTSFSTDLEEQYSLKIFDIHGKECFTRENLQGLVFHDCSVLESGLYFVEIQTHDTVIVEKMMKE